MSSAVLNAVDEGLPRRISVVRSLPHFDHAAKDSLSGRVSVYLDGKELPEVAAWDVDEGWIARNRKNRDGSFVLDGDCAPVLEKLKGRVEVRWSKGSAA